MQDQDKAWREIQLLIERDKAAALKEFHRRPFQSAIPVPARSQALFRLHPALTAVAASLLLTIVLLTLWLLRGSWSSAVAAPQGSDILSGSFLYVAAGQGESARPGATAAGPMSQPFAAWANALERLTTVTHDSVPAIPVGAGVDRGDPEELRQHLGHAIRTGAFERLLSHWQEFHEKEV
jgi:hypothetical protein